MRFYNVDESKKTIKLKLKPNHILNFANVLHDMSDIFSIEMQSNIYINKS